MIEGANLTRVQEAMEHSSGRVLLMLTGELLDAPLPPAAVFWRDFASLFFTELTHVPAGQIGGDLPIPIPGSERLQELSQSAPPMKGVELITPVLLEALWTELRQVVQEEFQKSGRPLGQFLADQNPSWHGVGRVAFHLAENKKDKTRPFAFLATYTHSLSAEGKAQHLPLGRALTEYAGSENKRALISLLSPVQRAAEKSPVVKELVESESLPNAHWSAVRTECTGKIDSLLSLLQGKLSDSVMQVITHREKGLFPKPAQIEMDCSCPDWAGMCKHLAAVLYGVGARLDEKPELLFTLRGVDHNDLISEQALTEKVSGGAPGDDLAGENLGALFGIELEEPAKATRPKKSAPKARGKARTKGKNHPK